MGGPITCIVQSVCAKVRHTEADAIRERKMSVSNLNGIIIYLLNYYIYILIIVLLSLCLMNRIIVRILAMCRMGTAKMWHTREDRWGYKGPPP